MCIITAIPANIEVPWDGLENGALMNNDGHGWAVASHDGIQVGKSMDFATAADEFEQAREQHGLGSLGLFHSRWATHGVTSPLNVHPFYVNDDTVVAHNGILPKEYHPSKADMRSDTRIFVDRILGDYCENGTPSRKGGRRLGQMIGSGNKLAFLSIKSGAPKMRLINSHLGTHDGGVWYSNDGYLPSKWTYGGKTYDDYYAAKDAADEVDAHDCAICDGKNSVDLWSNYCAMCESCLDCYEHIRDCLCYTSSKAYDQAELDEQGRLNYSWLTD